METENMNAQAGETVARTVPWLRRFASGFGTGVPVAIIVLGIFLLQSHSLRFWEMAVGPWVGWGWSILLELISLWLWYRPESGVIAWWVWRVVALTTTLLLLTGPLYQVSAPLFAESIKDRVLDEQIARAERSLETYQDNSRLRAGWQGKIDLTEVELKRLWEERWQATEETDRKSGVTLDWQRRAIIVLQVVSILVIQAAVVLAITTLSVDAVAVYSDATIAYDRRRSPPSVSPSLSLLVVSLQEAVRQRLATGQSYTDIERQTGVPRPYLSMLMNHFDRMKRGDRTLGVDALRKIAARMRIGDNSVHRN